MISEVLGLLSVTSKMIELLLSGAPAAVIDSVDAPFSTIVTRTDEPPASVAVTVTVVVPPESGVTVTTEPATARSPRRRIAAEAEG